METNITHILLCGAIAEMQERHNQIMQALDLTNRCQARQYARLLHAIELGDMVITDAGFSPEDWDSSTTVNGFNIAGPQYA